MSNWKSKRKILAIASLFFFLGIYLGLTHARRVGSADIDSAYEKLKILADVFALVERNYVEPVKPDQLINGAINGMLETLDPHSNYMPPEVYKEMQTETRELRGNRVRDYHPRQGPHGGRAHRGYPRSPGRNPERGSDPPDRRKIDQRHDFNGRRQIDARPPGEPGDHHHHASGV